jgi:RHS repeat-associated protein
MESSRKEGWYDYGARFYDPQVGRFITIDPLVEGTDNVTPYHYCLNSPIANIDPTGMWTETAISYTTSDPAEIAEFFRQFVGHQDKKDQEKKKQDDEKKKKKKVDDSKKANIVVPLPWWVALEEFLGSSIVRAINIAGIFLTIPGDTPIDHQVSYIPPPRDLPGFPGATKVKSKAGRARWTLPNGDVAEWDSRHGDVEVYDKTGKKHKGSYNPETGKQNKPPKKGQTTEK